MSATIAQLPLARLLYPISGGQEQELPDFLLLARERLTEAALQSERLAQAGWQVTLNHDGAILELVACKRHHTLRAAVEELLALGAAGSVYLDAPDLCSTISTVDLAQPHVHHEVDGPPPAQPR